MSYLERLRDFRKCPPGELRELQEVHGGQDGAPRELQEAPSPSFHSDHGARFQKTEVVSAVANLLARLALDGVLVELRGRDLDLSQGLPADSDERREVCAMKAEVIGYLRGSQPWDEAASWLTRAAFDRLFGRLGDYPPTDLREAFEPLEAATNRRDARALRRAAAAAEARWQVLRHEAEAQRLEDVLAMIAE